MNLERENNILRTYYEVFVAFEIQKKYLELGYTQVIIQCYVDRGSDNVILNFSAEDRNGKIPKLETYAESFEELESKVLGNGIEDSSELL